MGWLRGLTVNEIVRCVTRPGVGLWWGVSGFSGGLVPCDGVRLLFFPCFRHAGGCVVFQWFAGRS